MWNFDSAIHQLLCMHNISTPSIKKKRILINVPNLLVKGGVTNYFNALRLPEYGNIDYFYVNRQQEGGWWSKGTFLFLLYLKFLWKVRKYDLIHLNVSFNFKSYYRDMGFIWLLRLFRKKYVVFFHGWDTNFERKVAENRWQRKLFGSTYGKMDSCIVLGTIYIEKLKSLGVHENCNFHLETTVADDTYINEINVSDKLKPHDTINVLFLARILKQKGVYIALNAFQELQQRINSHEGPAITLNIAGDGPELEKVKAYVRENEIANVIFSGYVQGRQKHEVLSSSHILLFPTYYPEGQPCVNLEAMLYGMPVITRAIAGVPDLLEHGHHGLLTKDVETGVFTDFLEQLVLDQELRQKMGRGNHQRALQEFVPSKVVPRILSIYEKAMSEDSVSLNAVPALSA